MATLVSDIYSKKVYKPNSTKYSSKAGAHQLQNRKRSLPPKYSKTRVISL